MFTIAERTEDVNIPYWAQRAIEELSSHGVHTRLIEHPPSDTRYDLAIELSARGEKRTYTVAMKDRVTAASLGTLSSRKVTNTLLLAPHITPAQAEHCRRLGIPYADGAGNIYLDWDSLLIDVEGRRPPKSHQRSTAKRPHRAFRSTGLKVVFLLLSGREGSDRTYRDIAAASGASIGTVQRVMEELTDTGHLETRGKQRRLHRERDLFDQWVEAYTLNLYPSLQLGEYWGERIHTHLDAGNLIEQFDAQWGGESAVALQGQYLRPGSLIVYAPAVPANLLSSWRLRRAEIEGNVFVRQRFWAHSNFPGPFVPSTLVYADLVASGDPRQNEEARRLRANDALLRRIDGR